MIPDPSYNIVFYAAWNDWEEAGWIIISEKKGQYYYQEGGHCVMCPDSPDGWFPEPCTQEEALEYMLEWAEHEDEFV